MESPKISVHILAKETTGFGKLLFKSCIECLLDARYAYEIVVVNNGCSEEIREEIFQLLNKAYEDKVLPMFRFIDDRELDSFSGLRNLALNHTLEHGQCDYFHWIDTDECYPVQTLNGIKQVIQQFDPSAIRNYFTHFMINPTRYQMEERKVNVYKLTNAIKWDLPVHEHVINYDQTKVVDANLQYLHFGYIRPQWIQALKWMRYEVWSKGHSNCYREYFDEGHDKVVDYYSDTRTPDQCLDDRRNVCIQYTGSFPNPFIKNVLMPWQDSKLRWNEFLESVSDFSFWDKWQEKRQELGSWKNTIKWACEEAGFPEKDKKEE